MSLIKYTPATGRIEARVKNDCGVATMDTAFAGLEGFRIRYIRRIGQGVIIEDLVWPWPLTVLNKNGTASWVIEENTRSLEMDVERTTALGYTMARANDYRTRNEHGFACCVCKVNKALRQQTGNRMYHSYEPAEVKVLSESICNFYYYCDKESCYVEVSNRLKRWSGDILEEARVEDAHCATIRPCFNPDCIKVSQSVKTFKACSACKAVTYCSVECQAAAWKDHKPRCRAINDARKVAKAERKARQASEAL